MVVYTASSGDELPTLTWLIPRLAAQVAFVRSPMLKPTRGFAGGVTTSFAPLLHTTLKGITPMCVVEWGDTSLEKQRYSLLPQTLTLPIRTVFSSPTEAHANICGHIYTVGASEKHLDGCPVPLEDPPPIRTSLTVGTDYYTYCKSGFVSNFENRIAWEDPLWDGAGCVTPGNRCCQRHCWSHRQVNQTSKSIEVRWCGDNDKSGEDVIIATDKLEIWVQ